MLHIVLKKISWLYVAPNIFIVFVKRRLPIVRKVALVQDLLEAPKEIGIHSRIGIEQGQEL